MKYESEIIVSGDSKLIKKCFESEQGKWDRSNFKIKEITKGIKFLVGADDSVALRATLNSITKLLTVYEKMSDITVGEIEHE